MTSLLKLLLKNSDTFLDIGKISAKGLSAITASVDIGKALLKNVDLAKFTKVIGITGDTAQILAKPVSGLVDASKYVDDFVGLVPSSTDDILTAVVKNSDDVLETTIDTGGSVASANAKTLSGLSDAVDAVPTTTVRSTFTSISGVTSSVDDILDGATDISKTTSNFVDKVDDVAEVGAVLKKTTGLSKIDDVAGAATTVGKKADDAAAAAKAVVKSDAHKFVDKFGGIIQIGIFASFLVGTYVTAQITSDLGDADQPSPWPTDPDDSIYTISSEGDPESVIVGNGDKTSNEILIDALKNPASIAAFVILIVMILYILLG